MNRLQHLFVSLHHKTIKVYSHDKSNGGVKLSRTYQEDEKLSGYVMDLQTFDKVLLKAQKNGVITIEKNMITDIESATFEI